MFLVLNRWRAGAARLVRLGAEDADRLAPVHATGFARGWSPDEFETILHDRNGIGYGARLGTGVLAFALARVAADEAELLTIACAPEWRGCGLANRVLERTLDGVGRAGARALFLEVDAGNVAALALYARHRFVEVGRRKGYYAAEGGGDALVMRRDLADRLRGPLADTVES
jgi:[ribosomal protein S18]-alanine N-acetyltransferase